MAVTFTVLLRGTPLRRTYVSHYDFFRVPQTRFFRTNEAGSVTVSNAGATSGDPTGPNGTITVRVHAQNAVVRVLDGEKLNIEVSQEFTVSNGGTINITTNAQQQDHFRIMDACQSAYDTVFRQFAPFNGRSRGAFPFGQKSTIEATRNQTPRIEVVYPDISPAVLAFVEPSSVSTGYPLIHIKHKSQEPRLFGSTSPRVDPTLIPHEFAHALHFALMSPAQRTSVEAQYLGWITSRVGAGLPPFHNTSAATTPFVAWLECFGLFAENFFFFSNRQTPRLTGAALQAGFVADELSSAPLLERTSLTGYQQIAALNGTGQVVPQLSGDNVEGALYGALFLDLARRTSLTTAVESFLRSGSRNILSFDDFRNDLISTGGAAGAAIPQVAMTWGL